MDPEYKKCLEKKKIKPFPQGKRLVSKEIKSAQRDLEWAKLSIEQRNFKWCIIQSYYSMFHAARALLFSRGYIEKSHYCLYVAIRELFQKSGLMAKELTDSLYIAMTLREDADYEDEFSEEGARSTLDSAYEFIRKSQKIISQS